MHRGLHFTWIWTSIDNFSVLVDSSVRNGFVSCFSVAGTTLW